MKEQRKKDEQWMVLSDFIDVFGSGSKKKIVVAVLLGWGWKKKRKKRLRTDGFVRSYRCVGAGLQPSTMVTMRI